MLRLLSNVMLLLVLFVKFTPFAKLPALLRLIPAPALTVRLFAPLVPMVSNPVPDIAREFLRDRGEPGGRWGTHLPLSAAMKSPCRRIANTSEDHFGMSKEKDCAMRIWSSLLIAAPVAKQVLQALGQ